MPRTFDLDDDNLVLIIGSGAGGWHRLETNWLKRGFAR
jgi:hypothetical protein